MPRKPAAPTSVELASADPLLTMREVCTITRYSRPSIYRLVRAGKFPQPLKLGGSKVAFKASEIDAWRESRPRALGAISPDETEPDQHVA